MAYDPADGQRYYHPLENVICFPAAILQLPFFSVERDMAQNFGAIGAVIGHEIGHGFDDQGSRYGADGSLTDWWTAEDREAFEQRTAKLVGQFDGLIPSVLEGRDGDHSVNGELTLGRTSVISAAWASHIRPICSGGRRGVWSPRRSKAMTTTSGSSSPGRRRGGMWSGLSGRSPCSAWIRTPRLSSAPTRS